MVSDSITIFFPSPSATLSMTHGLTDPDMLLPTENSATVSIYHNRQTRLPKQANIPNTINPHTLPTSSLATTYPSTSHFIPNHNLLYLPTLKATRHPSPPPLSKQPFAQYRHSNIRNAIILSLRTQTNKPKPLPLPTALRDSRAREGRDIVPAPKGKSSKPRCTSTHHSLSSSLSCATAWIQSQQPWPLHTAIMFPEAEPTSRDAASACRSRSAMFSSSWSSYSFSFSIFTC